MSQSLFYHHVTQAEVSSNKLDFKQPSPRLPVPSFTQPVIAKKEAWLQRPSWLCLSTEGVSSIAFLSSGRQRAHYATTEIHRCRQISAIPPTFPLPPVGDKNLSQRGQSWMTVRMCIQGKYSACMTRLLALCTKQLFVQNWPAVGKGLRSFTEIIPRQCKNTLTSECPVKAHYYQQKYLKYQK